MWFDSERRYDMPAINPAAEDDGDSCGFAGFICPDWLDAALLRLAAAGSVISRFLHREWLAFEYGFRMAQAYLAANTGETDVMESHENSALAVKGRIDTLSIQP